MCRRLTADEIECRVAQVSAKGCQLLLYKTARVDRTILEETYGNLWQNDFKVIDGKMYGGIGIFIKELNQWLWRWDCGTESNTDAEKGQASDCFKRAGFKWGIGIELYSAPFIWVNCETKQKENSKKSYELVDKYAKFSVKTIKYKDNGNIENIVIVDKKGNVVFQNGKSTKKQEEKQKKQEQVSDNDIDIIEGLRACSDLNNLKKYYKENYAKVKDKKAFAKVKDEMKGKLDV